MNIAIVNIVLAAIAIGALTGYIMNGPRRAVLDVAIAALLYVAHLTSAMCSVFVLTGGPR